MKSNFKKVKSYFQNQIKYHFKQKSKTFQKIRLELTNFFFKTKLAYLIILTVNAQGNMT